MKWLRLILVLVVLFVILAVGCVPDAKELNFPPHTISYWRGLLIGGSCYPPPSYSEMDLHDYPHLYLRDGFILKNRVQSSLIPQRDVSVIAVHEPSQTGFGIEPLNVDHGIFLFAPISSPDAAQEYAEFMMVETQKSFYDREHITIHSQDEYENVIRSYEKQGRKEILRTPPTNVTRVTQQADGSYFVELVYHHKWKTRRMEYLSGTVYTNGSFELKERYIFINGPPGPSF
jgi:hypothetical protein